MSFLIAARSELEPKYRFEKMPRGERSVNHFCDDIEYDYGYCIKWEKSVLHINAGNQVRLSIKVWNRVASY